MKKNNRIVKVIVILCTIVLAVAMSACAQPSVLESPLATPTSVPAPPDLPPDVGELPDVPSLTGIFTLLAQGIGIGAVIAFLFEHFKWFQAITGDQRWWLIIGLSLGLPLLAQVALQFVPADTWALLEPYWHSLALGFVGWAASQVAHKFVNRG